MYSTCTCNYGLMCVIVGGADIESGDVIRPETIL